ncbi:MAG TPA: dethiobiotin synthase [Chryseosolibacter sp.]|nr:dethiobiotin synthase [Chryseosolibacter sp.]
MNYFITAIGTDSGKTLVSAILCEAFSADYWKPVQSGLPRDTDTVRELISNTRTVFHPEQYLLKTPVSPHAAARIDGVQITLDAFSIPVTTNSLIVEGAGGCMVPLNDNDLVIDLIVRLGMPVILVSNHYLGSINHTLLTVEALEKRNVQIKGIIFNGETNPETEGIILSRTKKQCLLRIAKESHINRDVVMKYAAILRHQRNE